MGKPIVLEQTNFERGCHSWIRTGDEVVINENGDLFVKDRIKVYLHYFVNLRFLSYALSSRRK
jgi:acyl-CoA synthetase (AMP-forming)/AMP-acid ligase II